MAVLDHHDRRVDQHADREREPAQRHDIGTDAEPVHRDEGGQQRQWNADYGNERRTEMQQEGDDHEAYDHCLFDQVAAERLDRCGDQAGAVVAGNDFDPGGQGLLDFGDLALDAVDYVERILAVAHHDYSAHDFSVAVEIGDAFTQVGSQAHDAEVADQNRRAVVVADRNLFEVGHRADVSQASNKVACARHFEHPAADLVVALADLVDHVPKRDFQREHPVRIEPNLILLDEPADRGDLCTARFGPQSVAHFPVLQASQIRGAELVAAIEQHVLVDPSGSGRIRADNRVDSGGELARDLLKILEHAAARPIDIGSVLEDDINVRVVGHRLRAHRLDVWRREHRGNDRIRDLIFDHVGRLT